jgi:hypothetical protein
MLRKPFFYRLVKKLGAELYYFEFSGDTAIIQILNVKIVLYDDELT